MSNQTKCEKCDHKRHPEGGHCYMFKTEPEYECKAQQIGGKHTHRPLFSGKMAALAAVVIASSPNPADLINSMEL